MNLDTLREERQKWLTWKNIVPYQEAIKKLKDYENIELKLGDKVEIQIEDLSPQDAEQIKETALLMKPWRKGPFQFNDLFIDSEWQSQIKYNLLEPHFDLKDKIVGDIGCNNGYYLFRMLSQQPKKLIGFDPSAIYYSQFQFINHFVKSDVLPGVFVPQFGICHCSEPCESFVALFACFGDELVVSSYFDGFIGR